MGATGPAPPVWVVGDGEGGERRFKSASPWLKFTPHRWGREAAGCVVSGRNYDKNKGLMATEKAVFRPKVSVARGAPVARRPFLA